MPSPENDRDVGTAAGLAVVGIHAGLRVRDAVALGAAGRANRLPGQAV